MREHHVESLIIGSGPAGYTAGIYLARAGLNPVMLAGNAKGGQLTLTSEVENYPGFSEGILGTKLMEEMAAQAIRVGMKEITLMAKNVNFSDRILKVEDSEGDIYLAKSVIISTGADAKWLGLPSETNFRGFGVSSCATCDGFFYRNQDVIVVGGGNTAVEEAITLSNYAKKVTLIHRRDKLRAEKILQDKLFSLQEAGKIEIIWNSSVEEILGNSNPKEVSGARVINHLTGQHSEITCQGFFVAIGHSPNTGIFKQTGLDIDEDGYIITQPGTARTNIKGVFAAGDVQDKVYRQAITAAASGCIAALEAIKMLEFS